MYQKGQNVFSSGRNLPRAIKIPYWGILFPGVFLDVLRVPKSGHCKSWGAEGAKFFFAICGLKPDLFFFFKIRFLFTVAGEVPRDRKSVV